MLAWFFLLAILVRGDDVADLSSDKYAVRQKATQSLAKRMNFKLYTELRDRKDDELEVQQRIAKLLRGFESKYLAGKEFKIVIDYPELPWICHEEDYDYSDPHLFLASKDGKYNDGSPKWTNWRVATHLWLEDKITEEALSVLRTSKDEKEFKALISDRTKSVVLILNRMIEREDQWWGGQEKNPLRKERKPDL